MLWRLCGLLDSVFNNNAVSINRRYVDGTFDEEVEEVNYFVQRVIQRFSVNSPENKLTQIPLYLTFTTFLLHEYGQCARNFEKWLGMVEDKSDLVVLRNATQAKKDFRELAASKKNINADIGVNAPLRKRVTPCMHPQIESRLTMNCRLDYH